MVYTPVDGKLGGGVFSCEGHHSGDNDFEVSMHVLRLVESTEITSLCLNRTVPPSRFTAYEAFRMLDVQNVGPYRLLTVHISYTRLIRRPPYTLYMRCPLLLPFVVYTPPQTQKSNHSVSGVV